MMNLIFLRDPESVANFWETDWLQEIFENVNIVTELEQKNVYENPIIIINDPIDSMNYIQKYIDIGRKFCLVQLSDEAYRYDISIYGHPLCFHVFRNHYDKREHPNQRKTSYFPLGYKTGFWKNTDNISAEKLTIKERDFVWSFCGDLHKFSRADIINSIKHISPHKLHTTSPGWNTPDSLSTEEYRDIMLNSIFIPCPPGWINVDTFRLYQALECGCIPITTRYQHPAVPGGKYDYFSYLLGDDNPIILLDDWRQLANIIENLMSNVEQLEALRLKTLKWWKEHKNIVRKRFAEILQQFSAPYKPKLVDCFVMADEVPLLKARLEYLDPIVDVFIISESDRTQNNSPKELTLLRILDENPEWIRPYKHKLCQVILRGNVIDRNNIYAQHKREINGKMVSLGIEYAQRNHIMSGLIYTKIQPEDLVILSNIDEFPDIDLLYQVKNNYQGRTIFGSFCWKKQVKWYGSMVLKFKDLDQHSLQDYRNNRYDYAEKIINGGWYCGDFGGLEIITEQDPYWNTDWEYLPPFAMDIDSTLQDHLLRTDHVKIFDAVGHIGNVFYDIKKSLTEVFNKKKISVETVSEIIEGDESLYLILGLHTYEKKLPKKCIVYQLEQLENMVSNDTYLEKLRFATHIWDYSTKNLTFLMNNGFPFSQLTCVPVGYSPCLEITGISEVSVNKTVVFYGSLNDRRQNIINQLRSSGIDVKHYTNNCWGSFRDKIIKNAAMVLNIHFFEGNHIMELSRVSVLLCNHILVISEPCSDPHVNKLLGDGLVLVDNVDTMIEKIKFYLEHPEKGIEIADRGYQIIKENYDFMRVIPLRKN